MGLASCEMKNEILGKEDGSSEMGLLNLGVAVDAKNNDVQTKADANPGTPEAIPSVSATGYIVEISNSTGVYKTLTYDPTNASVELPVDSYTMYAHKPGDPTETDPYYGGSTSFAVKKGEATDVTVTCKMENTKIQLAYSTEMQTSFTSWSITVKAGMRSKVLTYSGTEAFVQPSAFYWMLDEGVKEITVSFVGKNKDNKDIRESRVITKPASAESSDWLGGDALAITMKPGAYDPENPNGLQGIEISAEVTWNGVEDSVDVPVVDDGGDEPGTPGTPDEGAPTITGDCIGKEIAYVAGDEAPNIAVAMNVPGKIQDVKVQIGSSNDDFEGALSEMGLTVAGGSSLITNEILQGLNLFPLPKAGETAYDFSLSETLLGMLANFAGTHTFQLIVEDQAGKSANASFKVTIKETQAQ
jgi:hypothetical protein